MVNRYRTTVKFSVAGPAIGLFIATLSASANAFPLSRAGWPIYRAVMEKMTPRPGWAEFCRNDKSDLQLSTPRENSLTPKVCKKDMETDQTGGRGELGQAH